MADTIDAVVMGYDVGQGKRASFGIGDFLIGVYESDLDSFVTVAKVGTGLTDQEWREMKLKCQMSNVKSKPENYNVKKEMNCDHWVGPKIVVEILADEITKSPMHTSGYALRFPRLVTFREKKPQDATTVQELLNMFKLQQESR
ncbi:MAG: putative DNA ligase [Candidatus Amesbacteria bacterium GW2011_GWC2_47_8]|uniref:DNA ligase (ATP) n=1 Tax=Candidatus Amesbacteria bacterium GW2011_GWC2_47_8 TaxID=1618367 RepID=A0A0G1TM77_9BACT|nr:MAG: putative DNA ligase [Candidatus Amesbacteria bacterium GW2011_GWC2_47_8]